MGAHSECMENVRGNPRGALEKKHRCVLVHVQRSAWCDARERKGKTHSIKEEKKRGETQALWNVGGNSAGPPNKAYGGGLADRSTRKAD